MEDAGSSSGTIVEGATSTRQNLASGATVQVGETEMVFMQGEPTMAAGAPGTPGPGGQQPGETMVMGQAAETVLAWLAVTAGADKGKTHQLMAGGTLIGREQENDIVVADSGVSRRHAIIKHQEGKFLLIDLGSSGGTKVNGQPIVGKTLSSGGAISVGQSQLVVMDVEVPEGDQPAATAAGATMVAQPASGSGVVVVRADPDGGKSFGLGEGENVIGRDPDCQVLLTDQAVSRRHAMVRRQGDAFMVYDLGSRSSGEAAVLSLGSLTNVGMTRSANQDAYCAVLAPNAPFGMNALLAVADGMGGHQAGEVASTMLIQGLVKHLRSQGAAGTTFPGEERLASLLAEVIQQLNAEVNQAASRPETRGMGSTLTMALLARSSVVLGHVGDSRAYLLRNGQMHQISQDHSWVAEEVARGALSPDAARTHPRRNILTRAMGVAPRVEVDTLVAEVKPGDTLMLCSDGLHSLVSDEEIAQRLAAHPPQEACQSLVDRANELGGKDNITVVVARVNRVDAASTSPGSEPGVGQATTIQAPGRKGVKVKRKGGFGLLRLVYLPIIILLKVLKVTALGLWAILKFLVRRRR